jgi:hypothetical protein
MPVAVKRHKRERIDQVKLDEAKKCPRRSSTSRFGMPRERRSWSECFADTASGLCQASGRGEVMSATSSAPSARSMSITRATSA